MKFFYLAHSIISLVCLEGMVRKKFIPEFVAVHKDYEKETLGDIFFRPMKYFCSINNIKLYNVNSIKDISGKIMNTDAGICVGFMEIIEPDIFILPKSGILNLHCGKLPEYRGRAPISRTLMDNRKNLVLTVHKMDKKVDAGDICTEVKIPITVKDDVNSLYQKCSKKSSGAIVKALKGIKKGNLDFVKQRAEPGFKANKKLSRDDRTINWSDDLKKIYNRVRALTPPYPGAIFHYKDADYIAARSEIQRMTRRKSTDQGRIIFIDEDGVVVKCTNGILKLTGIRKIDLTEIDPRTAFKVNDKFSNPKNDN
jgi:methionyl-tRNA formyltransferase